MRRSRIAALALVFTATVGIVFADRFGDLRARLRGFEETPAVSTVARGAFEARINDDKTAIAWTLSYASLEADVTQSHIHFGDKDTSGGISVWLCSNLPLQPAGPTPPGTQPCPVPPATISGTFTAANVVGPTGQGLAPGDFDELLKAIRAGLTYANVHSTKFPAGEIRGQIDAHHGHDNHEGGR